MKKIILTSIVGVSFAAPANAGIIGWNDQYVTAGVSGGLGSGSFMVNSEKYGYGMSTDLDKNFFGANVGYGAYLQDNIRAEFDFEYKGIESKVNDNLNKFIEKDGNESNPNRDSLFLVSANLFADIDMGYKIVPYFGFGIGAGYLSSTVDKTLMIEKVLDLSNFAYTTSFMLGLSYKISDSWTAGLEYKNTNLYGKFEESIGDEDGAMDFKYKDSMLHEFRLSVRYAF